MFAPVEDAYRANNPLEAVVVMRADSFEEASGPAVKKAAIAYALQRGNKATGYGGTSSPYPCNKEGKTSEALLKGKEKIDHYRIDIRVNGTF